MSGRKTEREKGTRKKNTDTLGKTRGKPERTAKERKIVQDVRRYVGEKTRDLNGITD